MKLIQLTFPGLLFARAYAMSGQSQAVFGVLGVLIIVDVINQVVCLQVLIIMKVMNEGIIDFSQC